jgi:hypothetical protein
MRWLASFALLALCSSASCWAAPLSSSSTDAPLGASAGGSNSRGASWERLDDLLSQLVSSAEASSADSGALASSLRDARSTLTELSRSLGESRTRASELSSSLERCERSLALSEQSLKEARSLADRSALELRLWKGAALAGLALGLAGIAGGLALASR